MLGAALYNVSFLRGRQIEFFCDAEQAPKMFPSISGTKKIVCELLCADLNDGCRARQIAALVQANQA